MHQTFTEMQGFSKKIFEYMRWFAQLYPRIEFAKQSVSQLLWGYIVRLIILSYQLRHKLCRNYHVGKLYA
ncbi:TPA: DUF1016 family protein [Legionella pneumophila]|nr:DUF1016 family protein [Legionella pneumophila]HAT1922499.1 DUF1016 family protein [Legionella pneumophila]HAT7768294.1 DUF1016 family protein [Legionella pneumophila]HAU1636980.1 DUF1016 domain-containing protein [Legionella pneumophila]HAU1683061.1 DUF1016 domain-containing protein [Legionella pneumophila]